MSGNPVHSQNLRTYRREGLIFNLICGVYFLTLAPSIVEAADLAMRGEEGTTVIWLGYF